MINFTQSQLQAMIKRNQRVITELEGIRADIKANCKLAYEYATPDTDIGKQAFEALNLYRNDYRNAHEAVMLYSKMQKILKSLMRDKVVANREMNFHRKQK